MNRILIFIIIALLIAFTWSSAYYDGRLSNITVYYDNKFSKLTGNAVLNESSLKETFQKDKEALEEGYFELKNENDALKAEIEIAHDETSSLKSELQSQKEDFSKLQSRFAEVQNAIIKANEEISRLIAKNNELCRKLKEKGEEC